MEFSRGRPSTQGNGEGAAAGYDWLAKLHKQLSRSVRDPIQIGIDFYMPAISLVRCLGHVYYPFLSSYSPASGEDPRFSPILLLLARDAGTYPPVGWRWPTLPHRRDHAPECAAAGR
jgi:hypothetical protein